VHWWRLFYDQFAGKSGGLAFTPSSTREWRSSESLGSDTPVRDGEGIAWRTKVRYLITITEYQRMDGEINGTSQDILSAGRIAGEHLIHECDDQPPRAAAARKRDECYVEGCSNRINRAHDRQGLSGNHE